MELAQAQVFFQTLILPAVQVMTDEEFETAVAFVEEQIAAERARREVTETIEVTEHAASE
jgi:hypothetical protein